MTPLIHRVTFLFLAVGALHAGHAQALQTVDTGRVDLPGSSLFYEAVGHGTPIVLLHASSLDRRMWDPQFLTLADSFRVIRYDAEGHGRSGLRSGPVDHSRDLLALIEALGIPRVILVGCSLGGATAIDFALLHPERVNRLVLVSSGVSGYQWPKESLDVPWRVAARAAARRADTVGIARAWLQSDYFAAARANPVLAARLDSLLADNVGAWKAVLRSGNQDTVFAGPALGRLAQIKVPTLIVVGTRDVVDIQRIADTLQAGIPAAHKITLEGVGHLPNLERPAEFERLLRAFLTSPKRPPGPP